MKWSDVLARAPLPMLALAAAYGVFEFQLLFVPAWVALISALAFEVTYIALAFVGTPDPRRATAISVAAVVVSIAYNTLAALFMRRPGLLVDTPLWGDVALAVLHGLPLAVVAYNVAALLLHSTSRTDDSATLERLLVTPLQADSTATVTRSVTLSETTPAERPALSSDAPVLPSGVVALSKTARVAQLAAEHGVSETTIWRWEKKGKVQL